MKATEYKRERELDNSEPVLIKDRQPEKDNKDEEVTGFFLAFTKFLREAHFKRVL